VTPPVHSGTGPAVRETFVRLPTKGVASQVMHIGNNETIFFVSAKLPDDFVSREPNGYFQC